MFTGIEMKVEVTNQCLHGRCRFCSPLFRPVVQEAEDRAFLDQFERHLDHYLRNGGRRILLTGGGEPIDAPQKLFGALELINSKRTELNIDLELLTVFTNGVRILNRILRDTEETYLDALVRLGVRDINLSVHGSTEQERTVITGEYMGKVNLDTLIPTVINRGIRVMTRSTLTKGGVNSVDAIDTFAGHMDTLGVHIAYFSDLFQVPTRDEQTTPGSKRVLEWTDRHRVAFDDLLTQLMCNRKFVLLSEYKRHNNQGRTYEFRRHGYDLRIMLGDLVIGNEAEDEPTYVYVKPDGSAGSHNNARDASRQYVSLSSLKKYRPGRDDL
jgi:hypothetical protein